MPDAFDPAVIAADYVVAALGRDGARLAVAALRAGWLTPEEAAVLEPLAAGIAFMLGEPLPKHRHADSPKPPPPAPPSRHVIIPKGDFR